MLAVRPTELHQRIAKTAAKMVGMWAVLSDERAPLKGVPGWRQVDAVRETIAGGTSEIQRNILGERVLGLPQTK